MGRRYFCEYCNKSFIDDLQARKKHLRGTMHHRLRKQHYDSFRDPKTILAEESAKDPCNRYRQFGECPFGDNCRFSHYSPQDLDALRHYVENESQSKSQFLEDTAPQLSTWLQKRSTSVPVVASSSVHQEQPYVWMPPPAILSLPNLPPSLRPVTLQDFEQAEFEEWG